jgi:carbamoyl-phosphate synthase large subunit
MLSSPSSIQTCLDKQRFFDVLAPEFPVIPTSTQIDTLQADFFVVKECQGAGSLGAYINVSKEEALSYSQQLIEPIFQPYLAGTEWSVDLYRSLDGIVKGCVARTRDSVVKGESQITTTHRYPALEELCTQLAQRLDIKGHAIIQVIVDAQENFHIIECNPRFGGASTASLAVGLDSFYWFFLECLGQNLQDYPFIRRGDIRQIRHPTDQVIPWSSSSI